LVDLFGSGFDPEHRHAGLEADDNAQKEVGGDRRVPDLDLSGVGEPVEQRRHRGVAALPALLVHERGVTAASPRLASLTEKSGCRAALAVPTT
jgi:hypothetical protein